MTDLALVVLLRRAVLVAELPDVSVLASDAHMQGLDVLPLLLQLSLHDKTQGVITCSTTSCMSNHVHPQARQICNDGSRVSVLSVTLSDLLELVLSSLPWPL